MPKADDPPAPPLRTWRPIVLWSALILVAAGLLTASAYLLPPYAAVRREVDVHIILENQAPQAIERLGGPEEGARKLGIYLRLPERMPGRTRNATYLLGFCGAAGAAELDARLGRSFSGDYAAYHLAMSENPMAIECIERLVRQYENPAALTALGQNGSRWVFDFLLEELWRGSATHRVAVIETLVRLPATRADEPVQPGDDRSRRCRELGEALDDLLDREVDPQVRLAARKALRTLRGNYKARNLPPDEPWSRWTQ
jgi:hypothetical protein